MPHTVFDRTRMRFRPVAERKSKFRIDDIKVDPASPPPLPPEAEEELCRVASAVTEARRQGGSVVLCHGAHVIKNGLAPVLRALVESGWVTHIATNGAGSIHDWEFAFLGRSCEDVRENVAVGEFGTWDETSRWPGIAVHVGGPDGLGFGEAVGKLAATEKVVVPEAAELRQRVRDALDGKGSLEAAAASTDLLALMEEGGVEAGEHSVAHPWKHTSIQACCFERDVPFTIHPGIGQDIVYTHPFTRGAAVGRAALVDFLLYAASIEKLEGGVYISAGSSVMSPMIFEKSISMARNVLRQRGQALENFTMVVNDLAPMTWDWSKGEPPVDNAAYYIRFCKSFNRMGGSLRYVGLDNRVFLQNLYAKLES